MLIGKKYKIESDSLNITLYQRTVSKKTGAEYWNTLGYFGKVQNALKFLVDSGVAETGLTEFRKIVTKQDELYKLIEGLNYERRL